ncbi:MAG TPA: methyltransferase domain-containing protein [Parvibaculum sp.]|jgi:SAM-dependent methyltransferase
MDIRFSFDKVAALYDGVRPTYPDRLFDDIMAEADLVPGDAMLEVGCGTGQATRGFARRGLKILTSDPGPDLIRVAKESLAEFPGIAFATATFEALPVKPKAFKLLAAAQCWHWIDADIRFGKAAEALAPGGTLAVFGNVPVGLSDTMLAAFQRIYDEIAPGAWGLPPESWYLPGGPVSGLFDASGYFLPVIHKAYPWRWRLSTSGYIDFLKTRSDLQLLTTEQREALLPAFAKTIEAEGGMIEVQYEAHLYMAKAA